MQMIGKAMDGWHWSNSGVITGEQIPADAIGGNCPQV
jgi:hypothetical protein